MNTYGRLAFQLEYYEAAKGKEDYPRGTCSLYRRDEGICFQVGNRSDDPRYHDSSTACSLF